MQPANKIEQKIKLFITLLSYTFLSILGLVAWVYRNYVSNETTMLYYSASILLMFVIIFTTVLMTICFLIKEQNNGYNPSIDCWYTCGYICWMCIVCFNCFERK